MDHVKKFPAYESHYSQSYTSKYLPIGLNVTKVYDLYSTETESPVGIYVYRAIFNKAGLKFKSSQIDICSKCNKYNAWLKHKTDKKKKAGQKYPISNILVCPW